MIFNPQEFLDHFGKPIGSSSKWARAGWIQTACPFCSGHDGFHLGFNISREYTNCWRCGWHSLVDAVKIMLECSFQEAQTYIRQFRTLDSPDIDLEQEAYTFTKETLELPTSTDLQPRAIKYLKKRKYNPEELSIEWDLKQTSNYGEYKYRILAPVFYKGKPVTYQCRDYTGKQTPPYKACSMSNEVMHHKHILYGMDKVRERSVILVEGIADAWRVGPGSCATFGVEYTQEQITVILKEYDEVFIWYDPDEAGEENAEKLYYDLDIHGIDCEIICSDKDPGDMDQDEARAMKKELLGY